MLRQKSKYSKNHFKAMNKQEIVTGLIVPRTNTEPDPLIFALEIMPVMVFVLFLLISIPGLFQIITGALSIRYIILVFSLFSLGAIGMRFVVSIFIDRYIRRKIYSSENPQDDLYEVLVNHGQVSIGFIESANSYSRDRTLIRYGFPYRDKTVYQGYVTQREVKVKQNDEIYVLHYRDMGSMPLIEQTLTK